MGAILRAIVDFFRSGPDRPQRTDPASIRRAYEARRWSVFLSVTLGYGIFYVGRINFSVVKKAMLDEHILDATEMGLIGSCLLIGYAGGKLINGFLADRANIRRFMSAGLLLSAVLNLALGFNKMFIVFAGAWAVNGWLQAMGAAPSIVALSHWFSQRERGTRYGVWCISHNIGEGLTFVMTAFFVSSFGWRWGFWGPGLICAAAALILFRTLSDRPQTYGLPSVADYKDDPVPPGTADAPVGRLQIEVLKNPAIWVLGVSSALMYVARYGMNNWGVLYLQEAKGYDLQDAGNVLAAYSITGMAGSFLSGIISDRFFGSRRNLPCLVFGVLEVLALIALYANPAGSPWLDVAALSLFGFSMGVLVSFLGGLMAVDIVSHRAAGAAAGVVGMFSYIGAAIQDTVSGVLVDRGTIAAGSPGRNTFEGPFFFWIGASILSAALALAVWNAKKNSVARLAREAAAHGDAAKARGEFT